MVKKAPARTRKPAEVRRAEIIDEAIGIIGEFGYYGFTVQALADRCLMTNAGLLHYFGTKDALLLGVLDEIERRAEEYMGPHVAVLEDRATGQGEGIEAVADAIVLMADWACEHPEQTRFTSILQAEALLASHPAHDWFAQRDIETFELLIRLLTPVVSVPEITARHIVAVMRGLIQQWLGDRQAFDLAAECRTATRLLLSAEAGLSN